MKDDYADAPIKVEPTGSDAEKGPRLFGGALARLVRKFVKEKSVVDEKYAASVDALEAWKKECEAKLTKMETEIANRYDSIDVVQNDVAKELQSELIRRQRKAEAQALDAEIESVLGKMSK